MTKLKRIKKVRIHREGDKTLVGCGIIFALVCALAYVLLPPVFFYLILAVCIIIYSGILNFFRCPIRRFQGSTDGVVVAPADGKIVVNEEVEENEYFGASQGKFGKRALHGNNSHLFGRGNHGAPGGRCFGKKNCYLCQRKRRVLHRRAYGFH